MNRRVSSLIRALAAVVVVSVCLSSPAFGAIRRTIQVDGINRIYWVDPGRDAATTPSPLVLVFHGLTATAAESMSFRFAAEWPEATVVYPDGLNRAHPVHGLFGKGWQFHPGDYEDEDVRFVDALLADVATTYKVDERRVYATGFSNGAGFTYVLLTLRPERFAAFAPVGLYCPSHFLRWARVPRPVFFANGTKDSINPPDLIEWTRDQLLRLNVCGGEAIDWAPGAHSYQPCASNQPVVWLRYDAGHAWPREGTANVVRFLKQYALPAPPPAAGPDLGSDAGERAAGSGRFGFSGDGGPAIAARLALPLDVTLDRAGNVYVADSLNECTRRVSPEGTITTVAGLRVPGFAWLIRKNGAYTPAEALCTDGAGNLFIADGYQRRVVRRAPDGSLATVAGMVPPGETGIRSSGDGGPATQAHLSFIHGLAADPRGNLYIADTAAHRVRRVDPNGVITTVAGTGLPGFSGDGEPAIGARLYQPWGLAVDGAGNLYVADAANHRVRKVSAEGTITTVAGSGTAGFSGDGGPASVAQLSFPTHLAVDSRGNLFIVDTHNRRVRKVAPDGTISTVVGEGASDAGAAAIRPAGAAGIAIDKAGNLLLADAFRHVIRKIPGVAAPGLVAGQPFP